MPDTLKKLDYLTMHLRCFDRRGAAAALKVEALAHGATDRDLVKAAEAIKIAYTEFSWAKADVRYLIGWFNGGSPWTEEYLIARLREQLPHVNWWAWDHLGLLRWAAMPLPGERAWAWRRRLGRAA